ncbi:MAG TPA: hypothetical protein VNK43_07825 [Gemmatimonadales bacterium]|nr:hypothetical protein [Gemmatimonadales bacterium]
MASLLRRRVLELVLLVLLVHAAAIAIYYLAGLERTPPATRVGFTFVWTAVTLAVVLRGLRRVRMARGR